MCGDETPQRGVNDDLVYTSSHTAQTSGLTVAVNPSQNTTCVTHCTALIPPYTWFVTKNSAKFPERTADGWQVVSFTRDNSNLVFLLAEGAIRVESSVGLAHNGRASHPHDHYEWLPRWTYLSGYGVTERATHRMVYREIICIHAKFNLLSSGDL